jgi:hypothetical protein
MPGVKHDARRLQVERQLRAVGHLDHCRKRASILRCGGSDPGSQHGSAAISTTQRNCLLIAHRLMMNKSRRL